MAALALGLVACGDDPPPPEPVPQPTPQPPVPVEPAPAPAPVVDTGPCDAVLTLAMKEAIEARKPAEVTGLMKPEGVFRCQRVAEGEALEVPVTIQPNKCYTVLAGSQLNITEVDLKLMLNATENLPPIFAALKDQPAAQDSETGPTAAIGRKDNCYRLPPLAPAVPMKVVAKSTAGSGPLAVQVYVK